MKLDRNTKPLAIMKSQYKPVGTLLMHYMDDKMLSIMFVVIITAAKSFNFEACMSLIPKGKKREKELRNGRKLRANQRRIRQAVMPESPLAGKTKFEICLLT
ncbi:hypothetical protein CPB84DRAFT_1751932 [Gymnopilus junonius]|uniref:Uncharacterized protein n=1 Tax=Gymnopilus junonius TaxID=109634 RepID=A0A9P5NE27_GYMJU|nr:hypothetical protein CPB84DRAFT_1751932 [Gymnopilus junonius]